jgi:hypothetical protein
MKHRKFRAILSGIALFASLSAVAPFLHAEGIIGVNIVKHLSVTGGYQLGSALTVKGTSDRLAFRFIQKGALAGLEASF